MVNDPNISLNLAFSGELVPSSDPVLPSTPKQRSNLFLNSSNVQTLKYFDKLLDEDGQKMKKAFMFSTCSPQACKYETGFPK